MLACSNQLRAAESAQCPAAARLREQHELKETAGSSAGSASIARTTEDMRPGYDAGASADCKTGNRLQATACALAIATKFCSL